MNKPKVAFICVHNFCRSQIAEALSKLYASDVFESFSAGTHQNDAINTSAVRIIKKRYGIDMTISQRSELLDEIPSVDVVITMGCNVQCPFLPCKQRFDWGIEDPTGKDDADFMAVIDVIEQKVKDLKKQLSN